MDAFMDCVLFHGNLRTQDSSVSGTAVAIRAGRIAAVGGDAAMLALAGPATKRIDLRGMTLIPGFEDAHAHTWKMGNLLTTLIDLRRAQSFDDLRDLLVERRLTLPEGAWLQGRGFNEAKLREARRPTREDLDRWVPDVPVVLTRTCGHIFVANTPALQRARIDRDTLAPPGGVIEHESNGEPNGLLHETAYGLLLRVLPSPTPAEYEAMILGSLHQQAWLGITASSDCGVAPPLLDVYLDLDRRGALPCRMNVMPLGRPDGSEGPMVLPALHRSPSLCVDTVKFLADGGLSGMTAALTVPYRNTRSSGVLRFTADDLRGLYQQAQRHGWRIATHVIGDAAIEQVLTLLEELDPQPFGRPHRLEHLGLPSLPQLARAAAIDLASVTQAIFLRELGRNFLEAVPAPLLQQIYPIRSMLDAGMTVALSSDAPVVNDNSPLAGMHAAITRQTADGVAILSDQALSPAEALHAYTLGAAKAAGEEATRGSLTPGKYADLALLSADPLTIPPDELLQARVHMTMVDGNIVYQHQV